MLELVPTSVLEPVLEKLFESALSKQAILSTVPVGSVARLAHRSSRRRPARQLLENQLAVKIFRQQAIRCPSRVVEPNSLDQSTYLMELTFIHWIRNKSEVRSSLIRQYGFQTLPTPKFSGCSARLA